MMGVKILRKKQCLIRGASQSLEGRAMCFRKLRNWEGFLHLDLALLRALPM